MDVMREAFGTELYTLKEAAEMLGASVQRLHAMRRRGALAAIPLKSEGRAWEYHVLECTFLNCTALIAKGTSGHLEHRDGGISLSGMFH